MKKVLAFALSLVLILGATLPGTLAVSIDADTTADEMIQCTCGTEDGTHAEDCLLNTQPADPAPVKESGEEQEGTSEEGEPAEDNQTPAPEDEENGANDGGNVDPSKEEEGETPDENAGETAEEGNEEKNECTCGAEGDAHAVECPLYDDGDEPFQDEAAEIYNRLMACTSTAQMNEIINALSDEQIALLTDEQMNAIDTHYLEMYVEENTIVLDPPVVNFTAVAPFMVWDYGTPVTLSLFNEDSTGSTTSRVDANGVETKKTAVKNDDGTYTITLESFVTGNVTTGQSKPCDIILLLDLSTSMRNNFGSAGLSAVYQLDQSKTYIVKSNGDGYSTVTYCSTCKAWTSGCRTYSIRHEAGTKYTPKSSANSSGTQFYEYHDSTSRMDALKQAACNFVDSVAQKEEENKIAVVGFHDYGVYLTGNNANNALLDAKTQQTTIKSKINGINEWDDLKAATDHDDGLKMAKDIFNANSNADGQRNRVVVMITDGAPEPMNSGNWSASTVENAITHSYDLKNSYGATVYTISVMPGSNAANPTSDMDKYMSYLSSNYPDAKWTGHTNSIDSSTIIKQITPGTAANTGGTSYYLSADDISALESIFSQIAAQTGGASVALDATTVVQDAISDYFTLPEDASTSDIHIYTADATGEKNSDGEYLFTDRTASSLTPTISGNKVTVTGFDFSRNFVAETGRVEGDVSTAGDFHGRKLIIEFDVVPKSEFWGGNAVPTNDAANSGIYKGTDLIENYEEPKVNVPIKQVTLTANDANIYLTGSTPDVSDLYSTNYPEEVDWRTAYVKVTTPEVGTISNMEDGQYSFTITVEPKYDPIQPVSTQGAAAEATTATATANVNVFKPELTFKDSEVYYGDTAPSDYTANKSNEVWKHDETLSTTVTMIGDAPTLDLSYTPEADKIADGKINSKQDIPVDVTVKIGTTDVTNKTEFKHTACTDRTETLPEDKEFLLHVKTCSLTIEKKAATGTTIGNDEYFVFNVKKDGADYTQVTIKGTIKGTGSVEIKELPVGNYTVEEDASTAWRYTSAMSQNSVTLSKDNTSGSVTCTNTKSNDKWLNHFAQVINTYGKTNN